MGIDPLSVAAGAVVGAAAGDAYGKAKQATADAVQGSMPQHSPFIEDEMLVNMVATIVDMVEKQIHASNACPPKFEQFQVQATEANANRLIRESYKHVSIMSPAAFTINARVPILDVVIGFALNIGWNALDLPDSTYLWASDGVARTCLFYKGDDAIDIAGV